MGGHVSLEFETTVKDGTSIFDIAEETAVRYDLREFDAASRTASSETSLQRDVLAGTIDLPIGSIRLNRYELLEELVRGPVHSVFRARRLDNGEPVAVKVLRRRSVHSSAPERLGREWEIIRSLDHPHIVRAVDFGSESDTLSLVIEYLHGPALDRYVRESGPLPFATAADFVRQAAEALAHAHAHGVVHRDVKPSNLLLTPEGTIKVIDFGVAHADDEESSLTLIHGEALIGTADYMSPEQSMNAHVVDDRADVYSLGCTLYYLLTGQPPYPNGSLVARLLQHRNDPPPVVSVHRRDVPADLAAICERMMAKNPDERIGSMREVRDLLIDWLEECGEVDGRCTLPGVTPTDRYTELGLERKQAHIQLAGVMHRLDQSVESTGGAALIQAVAELRDQLGLVFSLEHAVELVDLLEHARLATHAGRLALEGDRLYVSIASLANLLPRSTRGWRQGISEAWVADFCEFARQYHRHEDRVHELAARAACDELGEAG